MSYGIYSLKAELEPCGQLLKRCKKLKPTSRAKKSLEPPKPEGLVLEEVLRIDGFPVSSAGTTETWSSPNSARSRRRRKWPLLLVKPSSVHRSTGKNLSPGNCQGLRWWLWNPSPCPSYFAPLATSSPVLTTSSGVSQQTTAVRCANLQEGPCSMFSHLAGVHFRCTPGALTTLAQLTETQGRVANE